MSFQSSNHHQQGYLSEASREMSPGSVRANLNESAFNTTRGSIAGKISVPSVSSGSPNGDEAHKLSIRREIELRKAKEKEQDEANFTFKPNFHTNSKLKQQDPPGTPRENRFDKLYSDALKRHITTHLREETKDRDLTFAPKFHSRSNSRQSSRPNSRPKTRDNSVERGRGTSVERESKPLYDRLSTPRRAKKDPADFEDLTFTPTISKRAKAIETLGSQEVAKRLYEHSKMIQEKLEMKRSESEQKSKETCTFSPQFATKRSSSAQRGGSSINLADRSMRYEEEKQLRLEEARRQKEEDELAGITLRPMLMTTKRPTTPSSRLPVHERLAIPYDKSVSAQVALAYSEYTFHPKLQSKRAPSPNRYSADYTNIHERLFHEGQVRQQEFAQERASLKQTMEQNLTFHPTINRNFPVKDSTPVFERLANHHVSPDKAQRVHDELSKDWTFSPALSQGTQRLASSKPADDVFQRLAEEERILRMEAEKRRRAKEQHDEEELKKLPFSPSLPQKSTAIASAARSIDGGDVYTRLNNVKTMSKSASNALLETASVSSSVTEGKRIVKEEKELKSLFERLSVTQIHHVEHPVAGEEVKKVVLPKENVDAIFNRLRKSLTQSYVLKHDSEEAEQILKQHSLQKEVPKIQSSEFEHVLDRLRGHTLSSAASCDMKSLSRSPSGDFSTVSNSSNALHQTLSRQPGVANKTYVDSLERSESPLCAVPRSLSPSQSALAALRSVSPTSSVVFGKTSRPTSPKSSFDLQAPPVATVAGSRSGANGVEKQLYNQANNIANRVQSPNASFSIANNVVSVSSYLDEPETIRDEEEETVEVHTVLLDDSQCIEKELEDIAAQKIDDMETFSHSGSTSPSPTDKQRLMNSANNSIQNMNAFDTLMRESNVEDIVYDRLPTPQLNRLNSVTGGLVMPPAPPAVMRVELDNDVHEGTTDLDSVASPIKDEAIIEIISHNTDVDTQINDDATISPHNNTVLESIASQIKDDVIFPHKSESPSNFPKSEEVTTSSTSTGTDSSVTITEPTAEVDVQLQPPNTEVNAAAQTVSPGKGKKSFFSKIPSWIKNNNSVPTGVTTPSNRIAGKPLKKSGFIPQNLNESQQDVDISMISVDEADDF